MDLLEENRAFDEYDQPAHHPNVPFGRAPLDADLDEDYGAYLRRIEEEADARQGHIDRFDAARAMDLDEADDGGYGAFIEEEQNAQVSCVDAPPAGGGYGDFVDEWRPTVSCID